MGEALALIDELAGTAYLLGCWVFIITHWTVYTRPPALPLWGVLLSVGVGVLLGLWSVNRTERLMRRIARLVRRRRAERVVD